MGNWDLKCLFRNLILMTANVASLSRGNSQDRISLPIFMSISFLRNLVCHISGIRNNVYICLNQSWNSLTWDEICKHKSNQKLWYFFQFSLSYMGYETLDLFTLTPPLHPFLYLNFMTKRTWQKAAFSQCFRSHMWPSFSLKLGPIMWMFVSFGPE